MDLVQFHHRDKIAVYRKLETWKTGAARFALFALADASLGWHAALAFGLKVTELQIIQPCLGQPAQQACYPLFINQAAWLNVKLSEGITLPT